MPRKKASTDNGTNIAPLKKRRGGKKAKETTSSVFGGQLSEEEVQGIFNLLDASQSGSIGVEDFSEASIKVGVSIDVDLAECMMEFFNEHRTGEGTLHKRIALEEFKRFVRMFQHDSNK